VGNSLNVVGCGLSIRIVENVLEQFIGHSDNLCLVQEGVANMDCLTKLELGLLNAASLLRIH